MVEAVMQTILVAKPHLWPRHRWTGFRKAVRDIGALHFVHNLFGGAWKRFSETFAVDKKHTHSDEPTSAMVDGGLPDDFHGAEEGGAGSAIVDTANQVVLNVVASLGHHTQDGSCDDSNAWASQNSQDRSIASQWVCDKPKVELTQLMILLLPLDRLFMKHFHLASRDWERRERTKVASAYCSRQAAERQYRLVLASTHSLEHEFVNDLQLVYFSKDMWSIMPDEGCTLRVKSETFRLLGKLGGCIHYHLYVPHQKYPCQVFNALLGPEHVEHISRTPKCCKDSFTLALESNFGNVGHADALAILEFIATEQALDISGIESRHASIRRQALMRSCQTYAAALVHISAEYVLQSF
eukprot:6492347-Amphidinium_carterae.1